jgi:hypothetical protein
MMVSNVDHIDQSLLNYVVWPNSATAKKNPNRFQWVTIRAEAQKLDAMALPDGSVMVDNSELCIPELILLSSRPKQFMIPNDIRFKEELGAPYQGGVRYFITAQPAGLSINDALNIEWPTLYASGAGIATLAGQITMAQCPSFRLYKLIPQTT